MKKQIDLNKIERILITRTDRIGDVVLSTPVIEALRKRFPKAILSMMVTPQTAPLVSGNPYLDEVIIYDKKGSERSWQGTWAFAKQLKRKDFSLAIHLHPTNRSHWVSYLAGIPVRIGYRYKNYRLLTHAIDHAKQEGIRHEAEYNFDLLKLVDVPVPQIIKSFVPVQDQAQLEWEKIKLEHSLSAKEFFVMNPGASCPSKVWPPSRFAELANDLTQKYQMPVVLVGSKDEEALSNQIKEWVNSAQVIVLTGSLNLSQLICALKEARLLVSNDTGPVHIAAAVDTPVISLFGRTQPGLSPARWKPLGDKSFVIHKDVGCDICYAHECPYSFKCLDAIEVREVMETIEKAQTYTYC